MINKQGKKYIDSLDVGRGLALLYYGLKASSRGLVVKAEDS
jgi:hypothetical protein